MFGEGEYNIVLEKVSVTESYLGLKEEVRNCRESEDDYQHCVTQNYVQKVREKCQCLPLSMSLNKKVGIIYFIKSYLFLTLRVQFVIHGNFIALEM